MTHFASKQTAEILDVIMAYARLDFSKKVGTESDDTTLNGISLGVNMLGEELEDSVISLKEKDQIIQEIHHRVKNNLQIISSLLNLQSAVSQNKNINEVIAECRNRIQSIALVHEMLYRSSNLKKVNVSQYIQRLCENISASFKRDDSEIEIIYEISHDQFLETDQIIPVGLIINEILTNSFKHAFPLNKGIIKINYTGNSSGNLFEIADNGVGLKKENENKIVGGLGFQLIEMLCDQLDGEMNFISDKGCKFVLQFP